MELLRNLKFFTLAALISLWGCGHPSDDMQSHVTGFTDKAVGPSQPMPSTTTGAAATTPTLEELSPKSDREDPPALITKGQRTTQPPSYQVPDKLRAKIEKFQPNLLPPKTPDYIVFNQHLLIDAKNHQVTFSGVLRVTGKQDEAFKLACAIHTSEVPWVCTDMLPVDPQVAAQKRFQATFKCLDTYRCDSVGVQLWVAIDGKLQPPMLFQADGFRIRRATSGDADGDGDGDVNSAAQSQPILKDQSRLPQEPETPPAVSGIPAAPAQAQNPAPVKPIPQAPNPILPPIAKTQTQPTTPPVAEPTPAETAGTVADVAPKNQAKSPPEAAPIPPDIGADTAADSDADAETEKLLDDPDIPLEITEPMTMPNPTVGAFSVPGIENLHAEIGTKGVRVQAVGWHARGHLQKANEFAAKGAGFISRDHGSKDFGTDLMVALVSQALGQVDKTYPGRPAVVLGSVANRSGGQLYNLSGRPHASHQTGLDADVGLPSTQKETGLWSACGDNGCHTGSRISGKLDDERFWLFLKQVTCADGSPVIAMFLDREIKKHMCVYVQQRAHEDLSDSKSCAYRVMQALVHEVGHDNHVHVRLRCPENSACQNSWVTLRKATGC